MCVFSVQCSVFCIQWKMYVAAFKLANEPKYSFVFRRNMLVTQLCDIRIHFVHCNGANSQFKLNRITNTYIGDHLQNAFISGKLKCTNGTQSSACLPEGQKRRKIYFILFNVNTTKICDIISRSMNEIVTDRILINASRIDRIIVCYLHCTAVSYPVAICQ